MTKEITETRKLPPVVYVRWKDYEGDGEQSLVAGEFAEDTMLDDDSIVVGKYVLVGEQNTHIEVVISELRSITDSQVEE